MTDLWPNFSSEKEEEDNRAIDIIKEQASVLEKKTNNRVKATFSEIKSVFTLSNVSQEFANIASSIQREVIDDELKGKRDVSELYLITKYKFEIYNDIYKFRVFVLNNRVLFPISLKIDEGIKSELPHKDFDNINSNAELEELLASVFSCQKMKTVVKSMMKES